MPRYHVLQGDITRIKVDAVVNAAQKKLSGGGGVDGAIHRAGGPAILEACMAIHRESGDLPTGQAVITTAGDLPSQWVIHTVGPIWREGKAEEMDRLLGDCYRSSLQLAMDRGLTSIAFPNISTGVYRFPKARAAKVAWQAVQEKLADGSGSLEDIYFVCFDRENYELWVKMV